MSKPEESKPTTTPLPVAEEKEQPAIRSDSKVCCWINLNDFFEVVTLEELGEFGERLKQSIEKDFGGLVTAPIAVMSHCQSNGIRTLVGSTEEIKEKLTIPLEKATPYHTISELLEFAEEMKGAYIRVPAIMVSLTEATKANGELVEGISAKSGNYYKLWNVVLMDCFNQRTLITAKLFTNEEGQKPIDLPKGKIILLRRMVLRYDSYKQEWILNFSRNFRFTEFSNLEELQTWQPNTKTSEE